MNAQELETRLTERLGAAEVQVIDESHRHRSHAGARHTGGGHYEVQVVSDVFKGLSPMDRHRRVYEALREEMKSDIHALSLRLLTPEEFEKLKGKSLK